MAKIFKIIFSIAIVRYVIYFALFISGIVIANLDEDGGAYMLFIFGLFMVPCLVIALVFNIVLIISFRKKPNHIGLFAGHLAPEIIYQLLYFIWISACKDWGEILMFQFGIIIILIEILYIALTIVTINILRKENIELKKQNANVAVNLNVQQNLQYQQAQQYQQPMQYQQTPQYQQAPQFQQPVQSQQPYNQQNQ